MPRLAIQDEQLSIYDFLNLEMNAPAWERWELVRGQVVRAMAGASLAHGEIVQNIARALDNHLRTARPGCRVYTQDARVNDFADETSVLPDIVVRCGPRKRDEQSITDPLVLIEVLSKSTEDYDRGPKWAAYQAIESLQFHAVVDQYRLLVETNTRTDAGWQKDAVQGRSRQMEIPSLDFAMTLDEIYQGVVELERFGRS